MTDEYTLLDSGFDELFPILRSITGPGIERSIDWFAQHMPLDVQKVPSGEQVFDWTVPDEWHCRGARLIAPDGSVVCDTVHNNLHVLNFSEGVDVELDLDELQPHLHSLPDLPDAVPYVTSYYKRAWGICLSQHQRDALVPGRYRVVIDADHRAGGVPIATCTLPGESDREIMLSSYLCHPSMANNELSGPLVLLALYRRLSGWARRRFTYRFVLNPETIGALCFLSRFGEHLATKLEAGIVLTCVGGPSPDLRWKASRRGDSRFDLLAQRLGNGRERTPMPVHYTDFTPLGGSDERQYCSPGFNLPIGQFARTPYSEYDGYHNSLDSKEWMGIDSLIESTDAIEAFLRTAELAGNPVNLSPYGEPQLGKRGLYPTMHTAATRGQSADGVDGRTQLDRILLMLNMADGHTPMAAIADACDCSIADLGATIDTLESNDLLSFNAPPLGADSGGRI